jgi:hypothetical protein
MFQRNEFPDELIEGPPTNAATPQPESKEKLMRSLLNLKTEINNAGRLLSENLNKGKTNNRPIKKLRQKNILFFYKSKSLAKTFMTR